VNVVTFPQITFQLNPCDSEVASGEVVVSLSDSLDEDKKKTGKASGCWFSCFGS
jgi:hypothetical protein